jgi:hypothetical protein
MLVAFLAGAREAQRETGNDARKIPASISHG